MHNNEELFFPTCPMIIHKLQCWVQFCIHQSLPNILLSSPSGSTKGIFFLPVRSYCFLQQNKTLALIHLNSHLFSASTPSNLVIIVNYITGILEVKGQHLIVYRRAVEGNWVVEGNHLSLTGRFCLEKAYWIINPMCIFSSAIYIFSFIFILVFIVSVHHT